MYNMFKGLYGEVYVMEVMEAESKVLNDFARKYMFLLSSTTSLERVFSMWSYIHDNSRNRLKKELS